MDIAVLGPLAVDGDVDGIGPRDRVVLAALSLWPGEVLTADQLADALWADQPPKSWGKVVQGCVVRLRKVLGSHAIETRQGGYRLVVADDDLDARKFERLVRHARELLTLDQPDRASYVAGEALALWRGHPFVELGSWDAGRIEAARLEELRLDAEELQLDAALRAGRYREVLGEAQARVAEAPVRERRWALLALAQYQAGRQAEALRTLHQIRTVLARELAVDPGPDLAALELAILRQDPSLVAEVALPAMSVSCPYLGLVPYDVGDDDTFFGRDTEVAACRHRLVADAVLVVVGPSGSGKSSLVRAGVSAALEREGRRVVVIAPGVHPMDALTALPASGPAPVLVVDQCEEVVSLCADEAERARFFTALVEYAGRGELIVALRADRLSEVSSHPAFARLVERGLYLLGAMSESGLRAAIEGPAHQAGLLLEPGLVDLLIREVEGEPGALPLLSHALRETWKRREGPALTVAGYRQTGGIRGAVAQTAEDLYQRISPDDRAALHTLLLRLVTPAHNGDAVRTRVSRKVVASDEPRERLVEMLVAARLVTSDDGVVELAHEALARAWPRLCGWLDDDSEGQRILLHLSVAADAWDVLGRPDSELYRGVRLVKALDWREHARPDLTPTEHTYLDASRAEADADLRSAQQRAERETAARRRTGRLAIGLACALVLALVAVGLAVRFQRDADARAADAQQSSTLADANRLAALSTTVSSLDLSLLLAAQATRIADTPETRGGLLSALVEHRRASRIVPLPGLADDLALGDRGRTLFADVGPRVVSWQVGSTAEPTDVTDWYHIMNIDAAPTEDLVAVLGQVREDARVGVFTANGERRLSLDSGAIGGWPWEVAFSPDGKSLLLLVANPTASGSWEGSVREVDLADGTARTIEPEILHSTGPDVWIDATFADDGSSVVVWSDERNGRAMMVDLADGTRTRLRTERRSADSDDLVPLPAGAAQLWSDGAVTLYDDRGRSVQVLDAHESPVQDIVVSPDRTWAASTGEDGAVILWDVDATTGRWSRWDSLAGHDGAVTGAEIAPDGGTLFTASQDRSVIAWDVTQDAGLGSSYPGLDGRWISSRPEVIRPGRLVVAPTRPVSQSGDGPVDQPGRDTAGVVATFLNPSTGRVVDQVPVGNTLSGTLFGSSVAVSPDRRMVAVTSALATTVLDTRTRRVLGRVSLPPIGPESADGPPREVVWAAAWTPDGSRLLLGVDGVAYTGHRGGLVVVDPATWEVERRVELGGSVQVIEQSPDGRLLVVGNAQTESRGLTPDSTPELWIVDAATLELRRTLLLGDGDFPNAMSFAPDGRTLAVAGTLGLVSVFDTTTWRLAHEPVKVHDEFVQQVEWMPDGRTVVTSGADGMVSLYDAESGLVRARPLPSSNDLQVSGAPRMNYTHLVPGISDEIVALGGERPGHRYPMEVSGWLAQACAVAGRDLTQDEWSRYLPGRPYRRTCG